MYVYMGIIGYILREPTSIGPVTLLGTLPRGTVLAGEVELGITTWVAVQGFVFYRTFSPQPEGCSGFRVQGLGFRV